MYDKQKLLLASNELGYLISLQKYSGNQCCTIL